MCPDRLPCKPKIAEAVTGAPAGLTSHPVEPVPRLHYDHVCKALRGWWEGKPAAVFQEINFYPCSDQSWLSERIKLSKLLLLGRSAALNPDEK